MRRAPPHARCGAHVRFMTSIPSLLPPSPARAAITTSASEPALQQRRSAASPVPTATLLSRRSSDAEELEDGTRPEEYRDLLRSLDGRSLEYLQLLQDEKFMYQSMSRGRTSPVFKRADQGGHGQVPLQEGTAIRQPLR